MNMWFKSSTKRKRRSLFRIWTHFNLFWLGFGCAWLWWAEKFLQKRRWFFFFVVATCLSFKTMCAVTAKQHFCRFLVLKGIFKTLQQALNFLQSLKLVVLLVERWTHFSFLHVGQYTSPIVLILSTHKSFFLYLVDWNGTLTLNNCLSCNIFLAKKKRVLSVFVVFMCSCNVKRTLWTNNQAPQLSQP